MTRPKSFFALLATDDGLPSLSALSRKLRNTRSLSWCVGLGQASGLGSIIEEVVLQTTDVQRTGSASFNCLRDRSSYRAEASPSSAVAAPRPSQCAEEQRLGGTRSSSEQLRSARSVRIWTYAPPRPESRGCSAAQQPASRQVEVVIAKKAASIAGDRCRP